ncbi:MAG: rhomboid family intramembrane serine protease [Bacteroidales bacterium]|nr:rhomboid family intramembrane serine protease [Bacteroidales bacterium]
MPPITNGVKAILLANIAVFILGMISHATGFDIDRMFALYYIKSEYFKPLQFITYMFVHAGFTHIFFNMFALVQFGSMIESIWGTKRFTFYYLVTGVGAGIINMLVMYYQITPFTDAIETFYAAPSPDALVALGHSTDAFNSAAVAELADRWRTGFYTEEQIIDALEQGLPQVKSAVYNSSMVGASGAVFGLLLAFGLMFPNLKLQIIFIPIGIPAKYFVLIYGVAELFFGIKDFSGDNIAHFAHLGGMLVGFILLLYWQRGTRRDYD